MVDANKLDTPPAIQRMSQSMRLERLIEKRFEIFCYLDWLNAKHPSFDILRIFPGPTIIYTPSSPPAAERNGRSLSETASASRSIPLFSFS